MCSSVFVEGAWRGTTGDWAELPMLPSKYCNSLQWIKKVFTTEVVITAEMQSSHWEGKLMASGDVWEPDELRKTFELVGSMIVPFNKTEWRRKRRFVLVGMVLGGWQVRFGHDELECLWQIQGMKPKRIFIHTYNTQDLMRRESLGSLLMMEKRRGKSQIRSEWEGERCSVDFSSKSDLYCEGKKRK